jgi:hypothetical protein
MSFIRSCIEAHRGFKGQSHYAKKPKLTIMPASVTERSPGKQEGVGSIRLEARNFIFRGFVEAQHML